MDLSYYTDTGAFDARSAMQHGHDPYSDVGWFGSSIVKKIGQATKAAVKKAKVLGHAVSPLVDQALPMVQQSLKSMGPLGMAGSGALGTMKAALDGKNLKEIGIAAAIGSAPLGVDRALQAGLRIAKGDNLMKIGMDQLGQNFKIGTAPQIAFDIGKKLICAGSNKSALASARKALTDEAQRRAFDTAVGGAAMLADKVGMPRNNQIMSTITSRANALAGNRGPKPVDVIQRRTTLPKPAAFSGSTQAALAAMRRGASAAQASKQFGAPMAELRRGIGSKFNRSVGWKPLSVGAAAFVRRHVPHVPMSALRVMSGRDTTGLVDNSTIYVVEPGDFPGKITEKLLGKANANKWPQLIAANPQKKTKTTKLGKEFVTLSAGERLNVPKSWNLSPAPDLIVAPKPSGTTTLPEVVVVGSPPPAVSSSNANTASILQAKAALVAWSKTDGLGEAGPTDYGVRPEDMSTTFGPRDTLVAMAFEKWLNRTTGSSVTADGDMNDELVSELRSWAERRASLPVPSLPQVSTPAPTAPPVLTTTPPSGATPGPLVVTPPVSPFPTPAPVVVAPTPAPVTPFPSAPAPAAPVTPAAASKPAGSSEGSEFLPIAGAVLGGLVFGPVGFVVGGGVGLAASSA